jgi:hypothetical protein
LTDIDAVVSGHIRALEWFGASLKLMVWCLIMSEHWNGLKHPLKLMVWCLGISEDWNGSEHPLKMIQQCLDRLDI